MLGTNDLKHRWGLSAWDISQGVRTLVEMIQTSAFGPDFGVPRLLIVAPPRTCVVGTRFEDMFAGADEKSPGLARAYRPVAGEFGCGFLDAGDHIVSSAIDGIHLDAAELPKLGRAAAAKVREMLS